MKQQKLTKKTRKCYEELVEKGYLKTMEGGKEAGTMNIARIYYINV